MNSDKKLSDESFGKIAVAIFATIMLLGAFSSQIGSCISSCSENRTNNAKQSDWQQNMKEAQRLMLDGDYEAAHDLCKYPSGVSGKVREHWGYDSILLGDLTYYFLRFSQNPTGENLARQYEHLDFLFNLHLKHDKTQPAYCVFTDEFIDAMSDYYTLIEKDGREQYEILKKNESKKQKQEQQAEERKKRDEEARIKKEQEERQKAWEEWKHRNPDNDPYNVNDYSDPEEFYYWQYDDFFDYEDAEDYWNEHHTG